MQRYSYFIFLLVFVFSQALLAMNGAEIMKKSHLAAYYQGRNGKGQILMKVYAAAQTKPIKKLFTMFRKDISEGGEQKIYTYFERPTDIRKTTFLVHKYIDKDDLRRLYIPASDKVLAISGAKKQDPFMGSDFSYEDVSGRHYSKDHHKLLKEEKFNGEDVYVITSTPKQKESKMASIRYWVSKKHFIPLKAEFINHEGKVFKSYQSLKIQVIGGYPTITYRKMNSPLEGTYTEMLVNSKSVSYDIELPDDIFTERSLKYPPMKFLK